MGCFWKGLLLWFPRSLLSRCEPVLAQLSGADSCHSGEPSTFGDVIVCVGRYSISALCVSVSVRVRAHGTRAFARAPRFCDFSGYQSVFMETLICAEPAHGLPLSSGNKICGYV